MAEKYLNNTGLETVWNKIKSIFGMPEPLYEEVEWVESTGKQYVYLDWKPPIETWGFEADFIIKNNFNTTQAAWNSSTNTDNAGMLFGVRSSNGVNDIELGTYGSTGFFRAGGSTIPCGIKTDKTRQIIKLIGTTLTKPDGTTTTIQRSAETTNKPYNNMTIFAYHEGLRRTSYGGLNYPSTSRIYSLKFYEGETVKVHLVGAIRKSDNTTGLYDKISNHFYPAPAMNHGEVVGNLGQRNTILNTAQQGITCAMADNREAGRLWRINLSNIKTLEDGQQISVIPLYSVSASVQTTELKGWDDTSSNSNVYLKATLADGTETDWIPCYYQQTTRLTTHYGSNQAILFTYRENVITSANATTAGNIIVRGFFGDVNYNTDRLYDCFSDSVVAGKNGAKRYTLCMQDDEGNWTSIVNQANNTGATGKTCYTSGLKLGKILYHATGSDYGAGANSGAMYQTNLVDARYSTNGITSSASTTTLQLRKPFYLVGTLGNDGLFYLDELQWWTQIEPISEDGKVYILVGWAYTSYYYIYLAANNPAYVYKNGKFRPLMDIYTIEADVPSNAVFTDTVTTATTTGEGNAVTSITASNGALTVTKGTTFLTQHQDISGKADKSATVSTVSYDSTNKKITKTINGTTSDVVTAATLKTAMGLDNAEANQNAFSNVKIGSTTISADSKTDTLELTAGNNITLTPDTTNDKVTIAATDTTYSAGTGLSLSGTTFSNSGVTGIKGNKEGSYRTGQVNLTPANIGAFEKLSYERGTIEVGVRPLIDQARANRLAFLPADQIIIEKTTDGGTTWEDAEISDDQKRSLFVNGTNIPIPLLNGAKSTQCGIRITITAMKYNVPQDTSETQKYNYWNSTYVKSQERYFNVREWWFWISANSDTIKPEIYCSTGANPNNWSTVFNTDFGMTGWSDSDWIRAGDGKTFGGATTQTGNYWNWRLIFWSKFADGKTAFNSATVQTIGIIKCYGDSVWNGSNGLATRDHLYSWDNNQNATFPAKITANNGFVGNLTGNVTGTATNVTGTVAVANGGTGKTSGRDAANYFMNALDTGSSTPADADYYISQYVDGGTTTTTYHRRPMSALWEYIKSKISSVLGLTATTYSGSAAKVNNHTVNSDVPLNAEFTDTTYSEVTTTTSGLMSATDKTHLDAVYDDLALMAVDSVTPINQWTQGSIANSSGNNTSATTRCRSNGYFNQYTLGYGTVKISIASGFKLNARIWDERMSYVGGYPADWVTSTLELPVKYGYSYRFVIAKVGDTAITPSDIPSNAIQIVNDGYTDMTLTIGGKSADAAAVRQITMPCTTSINSGTSAIIAAKTFVYSDGTQPVIDWYLLADYAGDLYISKDLKSRTRITRFTNWTQYKFAIRQNGDIIAVYRNEFSSTGSSYSSALDNVRQNPFVCLYSEGYTEWHEVDFGSAKKPCGWLENCGATSLPNGDIIFGEYTRMMVLYTSNIWRIKASADITQASSWEIIKSFRVAENDTDEYDDTVIEHVHVVQVDPYTGTVYIGTGDKGLKSQMWYSTDGGDTWVRQSFVDPDTSQTVTSGEKLFRLLNYNFTSEYVYWSSDSYSQHAVLRCERNGINGFTPNSIRILTEIAPTTSQAATYGTVLYPQYKIMVLMERLDASASSMLFRALDLTTNTLTTICTINSVGGASVHLGFRTEYTEFEPEDGIIKVGFSGNANYRNYNAICGNSASNSFEKNINNLSIRISMDASRNIYARFGTYYI